MISNHRYGKNPPLSADFSPSPLSLRTQRRHLRRVRRLLGAVQVCIALLKAMAEVPGELGHSNHVTNRR